MRFAVLEPVFGRDVVEGRHHDDGGRDVLLQDQPVEDVGGVHEVLPVLAVALAAVGEVQHRVRLCSGVGVAWGKIYREFVDILRWVDGARGGVVYVFNGAAMLFLDREGEVEVEVEIWVCLKFCIERDLERGLDLISFYVYEWLVIGVDDISSILKSAAPRRRAVHEEGIREGT